MLSPVPHNLPVDVAVHVGLPVAHVDNYIPGKTGLTRGSVSHSPGTLVIDVTCLGVRIMTLYCGASEVRGLGRGLGHMELGVPVLACDGEQILQSRG